MSQTGARGFCVVVIACVRVDLRSVTDKQRWLLAERRLDVSDSLDIVAETGYLQVHLSQRCVGPTNSCRGGDVRLEVIGKDRLV